MSLRHAACPCGRVAVECRGEPVRVSICHCDACRRRTGSAFGVQVRYRADDTTPAGDPGEYVRVADSGRAVRQRFCRECGTTVWWTMDRDPGLVVIAGGTLADRDLQPPVVELYPTRRYGWCAMPALDGIERAL